MIRVEDIACAAALGLMLAAFAFAGV